MKLIPASRAFATIRAEAASSVGPPNIMVPRQIGETFRPLRPRWRYCIREVLGMETGRSKQDNASAPSLRAKRSKPGPQKSWIVAQRSRRPGLDPGPITTGHGCLEKKPTGIVPISEAAAYGSRLKAGTTVCLLALQYLEHAACHRDTALVDGDFGGDEDQAAGRAHHMRFRDQDLADLAGFDEMRIELHGRQGRLARDVTRGHAAGPVRKGHQHTALHQAATVVVLVLGDQRVFVDAIDRTLP